MAECGRRGISEKGTETKLLKNTLLNRQKNNEAIISKKCQKYVVHLDTSKDKILNKRERKSEGGVAWNYTNKYVVITVFL